MFNVGKEEDGDTETQRKKSQHEVSIVNMQVHREDEAKAENYDK